MKLPIYMDNHATTPLDPRVFEAMRPYLTDVFGNAASRNHSFGWEAEEAVEKARKQVADLIGATPKEIVFTSGATESDNLALKGVAEMYAEKGNHIITAATEHKSHSGHLQEARKAWLPRDLPAGEGRRAGGSGHAARGHHGQDHPDLDHVRQQRNRRGAADPRDRHASRTSAACWSIAPTPCRWVRFLWTSTRDNIDLMSITGHKIYGPKGVGALYVRRRNPRVQLTAQMDGGGHERGMRSGTLVLAGKPG